MYQLGKRSRERLAGVDPRLVQCVERAIQITSQDFAVIEGVRTLQTQREYVRRGASQTMASRHLRQPDGFGKAVDLVPWVEGMPRWEWPLIWPIAEAMRKASRELRVPIRWGGGWFRLDQLSSETAIRRASEAYTKARVEAHQPAFLDGPHYEIPTGS